MQAPMGNNPSFVWRSLCWGRELLKEGLVWRVANGELIDAGSRNWFGNWAIYAPSTCAVQGQRVGAYITTEGEWREVLIRRDFLPFEAEEIISTKIERQLMNDLRFWALHPKGKYTVKTSYLRAAQIRDQRIKGYRPSGSKTSGEWWKSLWNLKIPPKVRIFWWQVSWDIIPSEQNLMIHHIPTPQACRLCGFVEASTTHALFRCPFVKKVWSYYKISIPGNVRCRVNTIDFLQDLFHINPAWSREYIVAVAWAVWKKRCELLHKDNPQASLMKPLSHFAVEWALKMIDEYQQACVRESHKAFTSTNSGLVKVIREIGARLVVFSDASFNEENGSFSTGTVVTDDQGNLIVFKSGAIGRADSPLEAEVNALLEGIKMAREVGIEKALFLSDCFEAVKAINEKDILESGWVHPGTHQRGAAQLQGMEGFTSEEGA